MEERARRGNRTSKWIRADLRLAIYLRDDFRCLYCGADLRDADPRDITLDHVKAHVDGGTNKPDNLVTACVSCNCSKKDTPAYIFASPERLKMIRRNVRRVISKYRTMARALMNPATTWSDESGQIAAEV